MGSNNVDDITFCYFLFFWSQQKKSVSNKHRVAFLWLLVGLKTTETAEVLDYWSNTSQCHITLQKFPRCIFLVTMHIILPGAIKTLVR